MDFERKTHAPVWKDGLILGSIGKEKGHSGAKCLKHSKYIHGLIQRGYLSNIVARFHVRLWQNFYF